MSVFSLVGGNAGVDTEAVAGEFDERKLKAGVACAADEARTANLISVNELASVVEKETMLLPFVIVEGVLLFVLKVGLEVELLSCCSSFKESFIADVGL